MCTLLVLHAGTLGGGSSIPRPLAETCGWPSVHAGGLFGAPTVRLAQRLLGFALHEPSIAPDGVLGATTTSAIKQFQAKAGITNRSDVTEGFLNAGTWPVLVSGATVPLAESKQLSLAVQDALTANGYPTPLTGAPDATTREMLMRFERDRGAAPGWSRKHDSFAALSVSNRTWHLLSTGCNSSASPGRGAFWFDAGWPQGNMSSDMLSCLRSNGFEYATFECWVEQSANPSAQEHSGSFWNGCVGNIARAHAAGFASVGAYMFPGRNGDPAAQASWLLGNLSYNNVRFDAIMLDIEGDDWAQHSQSDNVAFLLAIKRVFDAAGAQYTIYSGREWPTFFGVNFTAFSERPLFYAHYDLVPSFYDFPAGGYGGWSSPQGKQFWDGQADEKMCGTGALDWDWSPAPFWHSQDWSSGPVLLFEMALAPETPKPKRVESTVNLRAYDHRD